MLSTINCTHSLYEEFVDDCFAEHHACMGMDWEEIHDLIENSSFKSREKWLKREGYDLQGDFIATYAE